MKIIKSLSNLLVEQDGPDMSKFKPVDITKPNTSTTAKPKVKPATKPIAAQVDKDSTKTAPKPGELNAETKKNLTQTVKNHLRNLLYSKPKTSDNEFLNIQDKFYNKLEDITKVPREKYLLVNLPIL